MNSPRSRLLATAFAASAMACLPALGHAQSDWPTRQIQMIVPYTPGGFTDTVARTVSAKLGEALGQTIIVENKPGANSIIGVDQLAKSKPDGYTFAVVIAAFSANPALYDKLPYDHEGDIQPVSLVGVSPLIAAVPNDSKFTSATELVEYAKANPGKVSFGSSGTGSAAHLTTELLKSLTDTDMVHIPYKGTAPALTDLISGQIQLLLDVPSSLLPHVQGGKLRVIGVAHDERIAAAPDVPTFVEQGVDGMIGSTWAGVIAPEGTPPAIVERVATEIGRIVQMDDVKASFGKIGIIPAGSSPQEFQAFLNDETAKWTKVIRDANVKMD